MIKKYAWKLGISDPEALADFKQEAYIYLLKAIDYINMDKIINDAWKFRSIYVFCLKNLQKAFINKGWLIDFNCVSIQEYEDCLNGEDYIMSQYIKQIHKALKVSIHHYSEFNEIRTIIINQLTDRQKKIVKYLQLNMTLSEIGKELNISYPAVHWDLKRAKKTVKNLIDKLVY